ncbi:MAG: 30S ribosomal protein S20 [Deltaproteobacteria bacterium]|nr:30S ribosomal protein S20 [Deltaproteobacteria bacterium]
MGNHKSAIKRAKQDKVKSLRNKGVKTQVKNIIKSLRTADSDAAKTVFIKAQSVIDKAVKKGVIHKKTASRKISRLAKIVAD